MWGGLYGLSSAKIKGKWNPYIYEDKNIYKIARSDTIPKGLTEDEYVEIYVPCEEKNMYAYIDISKGDFKYKTENLDEYTDEEIKHFKGIAITKNNSPIDIKGQTINIYDRLYFSDSIGNNLVNAELQINDFEKFENNLLNASYDNNDNKRIIIDNIHEYKWLSCNVSLIPEPVDFDNIITDDDVTICYHTLDNNSNKRFLFEQEKEQGEKEWISYIDLYTTVSCKITDVNGDDCTLKKKVLLGTFYIVEDFNYNTDTVSKFINPINSGIEERKTIDNFQDYIAEKRFAIDVNKNLKNYNFSLLPEYTNKQLTVFYNPTTMKPYEPNEYTFETENGVLLRGNFTIIEKGQLYYKWTRMIAAPNSILGQSIKINKTNFPYNFKLVGETYIRDRYNEDSHYQIELYNCSIVDNINLVLQTDGSPTVVNIKMNALPNEVGDIGRLTIYQPQPQPQIENYNIVILNPRPNTIFCLEQDCAVPLLEDQDWTYLRLVVPDDNKYINKTVSQYYNEIKNTLEKEDLLIAKVDKAGIIQGFVNEKELQQYNFVE